jgi:sec-independent protein translocase protein TatA
VSALDETLLVGWFGHWELLIIAGVILLIFFGRRIPEVMRSLGKGITQFKRGLREGDEEEGRGGTPEVEQKKEDAKSLPEDEKSSSDG